MMASRNVRYGRRVPSHHSVAVRDGDHSTAMLELLIFLVPKALAPPRGGGVNMQQATATAPVTSSAPSEAVWNAQIKEAWTRAYASAASEPADYEIEKITGSIPKTLRGTVFRNGPGNFERGGERFKHVLDGDGLLCRFSINGDSGRARFASKFVGTPFYEEEMAADKVLHRNTFGTQPDGGWLTNVGRIALKNPANTNVQSWGGKLLALWEAALPCKCDPVTLAYEGQETFAGAGDLPSGGLTVTTGVSRELDAAIGAGVAFTVRSPLHNPRSSNRRSGQQ